MTRVHRSVGDMAQFILGRRMGHTHSIPNNIYSNGINPNNIIPNDVDTTAT